LSLCQSVYSSSSLFCTTELAQFLFHNY
jgi:hypothetical protein